MVAYYNENDPHAAQWLRNLLVAGLIAPGEVDERSIVDVRAEDLRGFKRAHFFAGIGGWSYALRLAGIPDDMPIWTGSCPCQPFSVAGKRKGIDDERHLWPEFNRLIRDCSPSIVFGEQVAGKDGLKWLSGIRDDLEANNYAVGAADLCAAGANAPHIRQRLYWGARGLEHAAGQQVGISGRTRQQRDADSERLANSGYESEGRSARPDEEESGRAFGDAARHGAWSNFDVVHCTDGKQRRIESGSQPLVAGVPFRLADGRTVEGASRKEILKGIGNAIVPQVAAEFIKAFMS